MLNRSLRCAVFRSKNFLLEDVARAMWTGLSLLAVRERLDNRAATPGRGFADGKWRSRRGASFARNSSFEMGNWAHS